MPPDSLALRQVLREVWVWYRHIAVQQSQMHVHTLMYSLGVVCCL
jgi:hypothetical protein